MNSKTEYMADVITRLRLESGEYDNKIKRATQGLLQMEQECRKVNGTLAVLEKDQKQYVQSLGQMETVSRTARGKLGELTQAFTDLRIQYNRLTDDEKQGDFGKALNSSLEQLKTRINDTKSQLNGVSAELGNVNSTLGSGGRFNDLLQAVGGHLGINNELLGLATTGTMAYTAAVAALVAAEVKAVQLFAEYNDELARQTSITKVTTGLGGSDASSMTASARALAKTYGADFRAIIDAANTLMTQFGKSGEESMQLIRDGMQGMILGDAPKLLSMIKQFAPSFRDAGIEASQLVAIIQNSEGGLFTDQNMTAIVMAIRNLRIMTNTTSEALRKIGIDGEDMTRKLNDGTMTVFDAMRQVSGQLEKVSSGSQTAGEVMQAVFGRQGTMAGTNLGKAIATLNTNLAETKTQTQELGEAFAHLARANERLEVALQEAFGVNGLTELTTEIKGELTDALTGLVKIVGDVRDMFDYLGIDAKRAAEGITRSILASIPVTSKLLALEPVLRLLQSYGSSTNTSTPVSSERRQQMLQGATKFAAQLGIKVPTTSSFNDRPVADPAPVIEPLFTNKPTPPSNPTTEKEKELTIQQQIAALELEALTASERRREIIRDQVLALDAELQKQKEIRDTLHTEREKTPFELGLAVADTDAFYAQLKEQIGELEPLTIPVILDSKTIKKDWEGTANAIQQVGNALMQIEDPAAKVMGTVAQAIATVALTFAQSLKGTFTPWDWIAAAASGTATMLATISSIKSATKGGFAEGGIVPGNSFSGDNLRISDYGINSGELILSRAQQDNIAGQLSGHNILKNLNLTATISGEDIKLSLNNNSRRWSRGEYVTSKRM